MITLPVNVYRPEIKAKRTTPVSAQLSLVSSLIGNIEMQSGKLPATLTEMWVLGNAVRCIETDGIDLVVVYRMSAAQKAKWMWFQGLIGDIGCVPCEFHDLFRKYRQSLRDALELQQDKCSFDQALRTVDVSNIARDADLNMEWASCFTWTQYFSRLRGQGDFTPCEVKVLRKLLVGRLAHRGLRVEFRDWPLIPDRLAPQYALGCRKIWEPGVSAEQALSTMAISPGDKDTALQERLSQITDELAYKLRELNRVSVGIAEEAKKREVTLDTGRFFTSILCLASDTSAKGLEEKYGQLEQVQQLLWKYEILMNNIRIILGRNKITGIESLMREILAVYGASEESDADARQMLRMMGMPEQEYVIYKSQGILRSRDVLHLADANARRVIGDQVTLLKDAHKLELKIRSCLPDKRRMTARITLDATGNIRMDGEPEPVDIVGAGGKCVVTYCCPTSIAKQIQSRLFASKWRKRRGDDECWDFITSFPVNIHDAWDTTKKAAHSAFEPFKRCNLDAEASSHSASLQNSSH